MKHRLAILVLLLFILCEVNAQDVFHSQPFCLPVEENPALAGSRGLPRIAADYRNQWPRFNGGFRNISLGYDQYTDSLRMGNAVSYAYASDTNGVIHQRLMVAGNFCWIRKGAYEEYRVTERSPDTRFVAGASIAYLRGDVNQAAFLEQYGQYATRKNFNSLDISAGLAIMAPHYLLAVSGQHLNCPDVSTSSSVSRRLPAKLTVLAASSIPVSAGGRKSEVSGFIAPCLHYTLQGDSSNLNLGLIFGNKFFRGSVFYRNREAFVLGAGFRFKKFMVMYAYDYAVLPKYQGRSGGANEIGLVIYPSKKETDEHFAGFEYYGL